jgi:predicted acylesterase/phospholipase RssA
MEANGSASHHPGPDANGKQTTTGSGCADIFDATAVHRAELDQIRIRRVNKGIRTQGQDQNLVGLALSGGGIRSAAVGLGLLQALYRRGVLRFVDYLSTVSGGGFAGAYLSSAALRAKAAQARAGGGDLTSADELPIAAAINDPQPPRMLDFIHSGRYLRRAWGFFNRYAVGLILIWMALISGLLAISSLTAWAFRSLDHVKFRDWAGALGFEGDVKLAFFPSFVLFALWLLLWTASYWKYVSRATGRSAQYVFVLLIMVTVVAFAALLGNGDIQPAVSAETSVKDTSNQTWNRFGDLLQTILFSAIIAGILPYLAPKKLFRSGAAPDAKPVERFAFWFATRALVFGIPFLSFSYFARENISGWNELRDDRIARAEVKEWAELNPKFGRHGAIWGDNDPPEVMKLFQKADRLEIEQKRYETADATADELKTRRDNDGLGTEHITFGRRWWQFAEYVLLKAGGDRDEARATQYRKNVQARRDRRETQEKIVAQLNVLLENPLYWEKLSPERMTLPEFIRVLAAPLGVPGYTPRTINLTVEKKAALDTAKKAIKEALRDGTAIVSQDQHGTPTITDLENETLRRAVFKANRALVDAWFPGVIRSRNELPYSSIVLAADQAERWSWFTWSATIFLITGLLVNLNATSWHGYYAEQVQQAWIDEVDGVGRDIRLAQLSTCEAGFPYHLISATIHLFGRRDDRRAHGTREAFLFSHLFCGAGCLRAFRRTSQWMEGNYTLADATAVSGGAVSPVESRNPLLLVLLFLGNIRLGQWVENPSARTDKTSLRYRFGQLWPMSPLRALATLWMPVNQRGYCFVADGGHHENLGIEPLLQRRCRLIIACDAGSDEQYQFTDFNRLATRMRLYHGITFTPLAEKDSQPLLDGLMPDKETRLSREHFLIARINYPAAENRPASYLVYAKSTVTGATPEELRRYAQQNSPFPHDSTADQFYSPPRFEAYRQLGEHLGTVVCGKLPRNLPWNDADGLIDALVGNVAYTEDTTEDKADAEEFAGAGGEKPDQRQNGGGAKRRPR